MERQPNDDDDDNEPGNVTITQPPQFRVNITDKETSSVSDGIGSVIQNDSLVSSGSLYKNATEDFWGIFNLNSTLPTVWKGNMTSNSSSDIDLPDDISKLSCDFMKEYGSWNIKIKYSRDELKARLCVCTGMCKGITLSPDVKQQVHEEVYGAMSDSNRPVFIAVVTVYSLLLLVGITGNSFSIMLFDEFTDISQ